MTTDGGGDDRRRAGRAAPVLLADIGGTNARFALLDAATGARGPIRTLPVAGHASPEAAAAAFLAGLGETGSPPPRAGVFAVAGPVVEQRCVLTNAAWVVDGAALRQALGLAELRVVNDFEALAHGLPHLVAPEDLHALGGGTPEPGAPLRT